MGENLKNMIRFVENKEEEEFINFEVTNCDLKIK